MATRCKVTFFDLEHQMGRSVEVQEASPMAAAEAALKLMSQRALFAKDFGDSVRVEVISTVEYSLALDTVAERIAAGSRSRVA